MIFPGRNYRLLMKAQPLMPRRLVAGQVAQAAHKIRGKTESGMTRICDQSSRH